MLELNGQMLLCYLALYVVVVVAVVGYRLASLISDFTNTEHTKERQLPNKGRDHREV